MPCKDKGDLTITVKELQEVKNTLESLLVRQRILNAEGADLRYQEEEKSQTEEARVHAEETKARPCG